MAPIHAVAFKNVILVAIIVTGSQIWKWVLTRYISVILLAIKTGKTFYHLLRNLSKALTEVLSSFLSTFFFNKELKRFTSLLSMLNVSLVSDSLWLNLHLKRPSGNFFKA